ncbi:SRPBCC domain-containing protein [Nonomuraea sp. KC401]|nr:SRPBCC domain-containing protein [Nonomuraea sp. KC401]
MPPMWTLPSSSSKLAVTTSGCPSAETVAMSFPVTPGPTLQTPSNQEDIVKGGQQPPEGQYALDVERVIDAPAESVFDAFIALYDSRRPDWVTRSELDLRPGGRWSVAFQVPNGPAFREERVITAVEQPHRLAYDMTAIYEDAPSFSTTVEITIDAAPDGQRIRLVQRGFPTAETRDDFAGGWPDVLDELARRTSMRRGGGEQSEY